MKQIIEQIKKICGVVTVESAGENMAVVVFGAEKRPKLKTEDNFTLQIGEFCWAVRIGITDSPVECKVCANMPESLKYFRSIENAKKYIKDNEPKPKSLKPEELIDGEIYVDDDGDVSTSIFRHKERRGFHSRKFVKSGRYYSVGEIIANFIRPATLAEKQTLIKEEIKNGYFHELK